MLAYKASDVKLSWANKDNKNEFPVSCGYVKEGLELESDEDEENDEDSFNETLTDYDSKYYGNDQFFPSPLLMNFTRIMKSKPRQKRQADQYEYTPTKTRCPLLLVADYRFFQEMGGSNTKTTINYLVSKTLFFSL